MGCGGWYGWSAANPMRRLATVALQYRGCGRRAEDVEWCSEWCGGVDEEIVAQFERSLIVAAAGGGDASGCEDGDFGVDDEDIRRLGCLGRLGGEGAVAFA